MEQQPHDEATRFVRPEFFARSLMDDQRVSNQQGVFDQCRAVGSEQIERVKPRHRLARDTPRIKHKGIANRLAAVIGDFGILALGVDHQNRAAVGEQVWDDGRYPLARARCASGHQMPLAGIMQGMRNAFFGILRPRFGIHVAQRAEPDSAFTNQAVQFRMVKRGKFCQPNTISRLVTRTPKAAIILRNRTPPKILS